MRSEESTETSLAALPQEEWDGEPAPYRQHPLPWVLFAVAIVVFGGLGVALALRVTALTKRADQDLKARSVAEAGQKQAEAARDEATGKVSQLEAQVKELTDARDALATRVKTLEEQKPGTATATVEAAKPTPPPVKKKPTRKKKRRR